MKIKRLKSSSGFTYIELLVASAMLMGSLLAITGMFVTGLSQVDTAGNTTMAMSAARQFLEDVRRLPYDNLVNLHGFDTEDPLTLPGADPELQVARRWRYALAGESVGWTFSTEEKANWPMLANQGDSLNAAGSIEAVQLTATITEITVSISVPGRWRPLQIATRMAKL